MKILDVRAAHPLTAGGPPDWRTSLGQMVAAVGTDAGEWWGIGVGGGGPAAVHVIEHVLRPLLIGQPLEGLGDIERLWERMYQATLAFGRKGLAIMAISAVDLALWDALGKAQNTSVANLLGGTRHERLPCYATGRQPEQAVRSGFRAVKLPLAGVTSGGIEAAIDLVAQTRAAIGPDVALMVDAWGQWDLEQSLRAAEALARYDVRWLEEPLPPNDLEGYAALSRRSPIPIAGGEHEYTVHGFRELAAHGAHAVWQPDVCWTGGLTQMRAIYALAAEHGVRVVPHRGAEAWSLPAIAALDPLPLAESGRSWLTWLLDQPQIVEGHVAVPTAPGFGVRLAPEVMADVIPSAARDQ